MYRVAIVVLSIILIFVLYKMKTTAKVVAKQVEPKKEPQNETFSGVYKPMITLHHTTWCPACTGFKPTWLELQKDYRVREKYVFAENDEDKNPTVGITGYPTITAAYGANLHKYVGPRDIESIVDWLSKPK